MREQRAARGPRVELRAKVRRAAEKLLDRAGVRVERVHLAAQRLELGEREVARQEIGVSEHA